MSIKERIRDFVQLGKILGHLSTGESWSGFELGLTESEFNNFEEIIKGHKHINGWFEQDQIRLAMKAWSLVLTEEKLTSWLDNYPNVVRTPRRVGVIMAGNIPLVGFHDYISVLMSGNILVGKLSSDADRMLPAISKILIGFNEDWTDRIVWKKGKLEGYDAVIATGSNNTARYFEYYFRKVPHIIRKNRTGVAILTGEESKEQLTALGQDVFQYFGLGCRNISKIYIPKDFVLDRFFEAIYDFNEIANLNKYANNYDYNRAIYLMNQDPFLENGFVCMKEVVGDLTSPVGVIFYERYDSKEEIMIQLEARKDEIQCIVGKDSIPFGHAQFPELDEYADGVDTMAFLGGL
ncbi:MAG: hypothetical protein ACI8XB_000632 [Patiriisocius sp.]|jgi:hypothetical protein